MSTMDNTTCRSLSAFTLSGIPYLEDFNVWFGFPLILMYIVAVLGNTTIIYIIIKNHSLHKPMYIFLSMLTTVDLLLATSTMPQMLGIFWFDRREISFSMCLAQMFFIAFLSAVESGVLLAMAVDRYVAICHPLKYSSVFTPRTITKIFVAIIVRGAAGLIPFPLIIKRLPLWKNHLLSHSYCLHQEVMKSACGNINLNIIYGLFIILFIMGLDSVFIFISYLLIIKTMAGLVKGSSLKGISTCTAHICAVLIYYIPLLGLSVVHRFNKSGIPNIHILFGNVYLLFPPVINPLIYGIKTKEIWNKLSKLLRKICQIS
ncbi:olfactory receptor 51E1-like [Hyperolius riggenbachi]|uniref:olfactory receptor 51E1-like n=1 Tax=Hyperolius riggenbachi TaxID=752182 RepID=UPI0035A2FAD8